MFHCVVGKCALSLAVQGISAADLQTVWNRALTLCIEVRGQADGPADMPTVLLEKWNLRIVSKRYIIIVSQYC